MLNIHTHLLSLVETGKITTDDFFILLSIAKRIDRKNQAFPSVKTLMKESNFGKTKVQTCLSSLQAKGFFTKEQRRIKNKEGKEVLSSNIYTIKTNLIAVYINVQDEKLEESCETVFEATENEAPENQPISIKQEGSIDQFIEGKKKETKKFNFNAYDYIHVLVQNDTISTELASALLDWLELRKIKKTPTTQKAIDLAVKLLLQFPERQLQMVENSIMNGWTGIFEIKQSTGKYSDQEKTYQQNSAVLQAQKEAEKQVYDTLPQVEPEQTDEDKRKHELEMQIQNAGVEKIKNELEAGTFDFSQVSSFARITIKNIPDITNKAQAIYGNLLSQGKI